MGTARRLQCSTGNGVLVSTKSHLIPRRRTMLYWAAVFFIIALLAGLFGFWGLAAGAAGIAKILFFVFLVLAVIALLFRGRAPI
jgi:uncharacterized membrane protein YtjA (UPF0391 family)